MIGAAWAGAITLMLPIAIYQRIRALPGGARKCEEVWKYNWVYFFTDRSWLRPQAPPSLSLSREDAAIVGSIATPTLSIHSLTGS